MAVSIEQLTVQRDQQRQIVDQLEQAINDDYRNYNGSHHVVMIVMLVVLTLLGGGMISLYIGVFGVLGLAAYAMYLVSLGKKLDLHSKQLAVEEHQLMEIEKQIQSLLEQAPSEFA